VTEIASITYRAERVLGMRFSNPVAQAGKIDLLRARDTDEETIQACADLARRMSLQAMIVKERE
jgi:3-hydroxybutyryl-CoA dehydrogenase